MAVEQLDSLSRQQVSPAAPSADSVAQAWPGFAAAARQLISVCVASHNRHDPVQRAAAAVATGGPYGPSTGAGEARLARAADLIGAAADLVEPQARTVAAAERRAACVDAARIYLLGAQITVHATMHDLRLLDTAAAAAVAARDAGKVLSGDPEQGSDGRLALITTVRRPQPSAGDLLGLFNLAVFDWRVAAQQAARRPDVSSEDLRGAAIGAGRITALTQVLHRAHWHGHLAETEARETDLALTRLGRGLTAVANGWTSFATGTAPSPDLIQSSSRLQQSVSLLACDGPVWIPGEELSRRVAPLPALRSAQAALADVGAVVQQHHDVMRSMVSLGRLYRRWTQSDQPQQVVNVLRKTRWVPASAWDIAVLSRSYSRAVQGIGLVGKPRVSPAAAHKPVASTEWMLDVKPAGVVYEVIPRVRR